MTGSGMSSGSCSAAFLVGAVSRLVLGSSFGYGFGSLLDHRAQHREVRLSRSRRWRS